MIWWQMDQRHSQCHREGAAVDVSPTGWCGIGGDVTGGVWKPLSCVSHSLAHHPPPVTSPLNLLIPGLRWLAQLWAGEAQCACTSVTCAYWASLARGQASDDCACTLHFWTNSGVEASETQCTCTTVVHAQSRGWLTHPLHWVTSTLVASLGTRMLDLVN